MEFSQTLKYILNFKEEIDTKNFLVFILSLKFNVINQSHIMNKENESVFKQSPLDVVVCAYSSAYGIGLKCWPRKA